MIISVILLSISMISYLYFGIYVFLIDTKDPKYRNFLYVCLSFFLWSFSYLLLITTNDTKIFVLINKIANISRFIYVPFLMRFFLILTGYYYKIKQRILFNILIWIIPLFYMLNSIFAVFLTSGWELSVHIIFNIYNLTNIILLIIWGSLSKYKREKKLSYTIFTGSLIAIIITVLSDYIAKLTTMPNLTPALILIWILFVFYSMVKYQVFTCIPAFINQDIIDNIKESIIIINDKKNIFYFNNKTKSILNESNILNNNLEMIIFEYFRINIELDKLIEGRYKNFSCRIHYLRNKKDKILIDALFSTIKDKFGDFLGILIIGNEIKGLKQLKTFYKTTERESEIIQELAEGYSNKNISEHLGISENTLKRHIANIYAKLGISNKVGLLNLLKDFNLIPDNIAEKTVLILNKL